MEYKLVKKTGQNRTLIEADILDITLTPNRYNALAPAIVHLSNDVTIATYCERHWMGPKSFWNLRIGTRTYLYFFRYKV